MDQLGNDMLVEPQEFEEKQDVAIISPDDPVEDADQEPEIRADSFDEMLAKFMPELPDQETESEAYHTWHIQNWRQLTRREHGPVFECGKHPWRILFFPYGNNVDCASFYLEQGFGDKPPDDWYACVQFMLVMWNPNDPTIYLTHSANHRFTADEGDWGFTRFADLRRIFTSNFDNKDRPMVENDSVMVTAYVRVLKDPTGVLWHNFINYDSKKETGMVGLKNQGATCYLNSLLQSLYFTTAFRKAVYQIPTEQEADKANSAYALQRLFYRLQRESGAVSTTELTASFGWESKQIFEQQDVQELSRILMERMEERMKGTEAENALAKMFVGKMKTYISCINVDYESSRIEDFWDIQLNVRGNKSLDDSFKDYIQVETMEGDNKYFAEGYGLQDAKKGVIFETFPQVLHLQLKRFEYDWERDALMKINDRYEFPEVFDASPYLDEKADRSEPYIYHLHGILVHSGDLNAGHYYAFLKPTKDAGYYRFDDDRVTRATKKEALDDNFGGEYASTNGVNGVRNPYTRTFSNKKSNNAYMLVYIRESRQDEVLRTEELVEPPSHLERKLAEERALLEKRRREREEAHLYMNVQVATEDNFRAYQGFDIVQWNAEPNTPPAPKSYKVLKTTTLQAMTQLAAKEIQADPEVCRPWVMVNRQNGTVRPDQPLMFPTMTVEEAAQKYSTKNSTFRIFMETTDLDDEGKPKWGDVVPSADGQPNSRQIILFLKHYDPEKQSLYGVGHVYIGWQQKVSDLAPMILDLMGWPSNSCTLRLWEEIKQNMIEPMKAKITLAASEIQDGDIICFQRGLNDKEIQEIQSRDGCVDAREFYDYLLNRIVIHFRHKTAPEENEKTYFDLTLSKKMTYDQVAAKVGEQIDESPDHLRFFTVNLSTGKPKAVVKRTPASTLASILMPGYGTYSTQNQSTDRLYFEVLELSLAEIETRRPIKVTWLSDGIQKEEQLDLLVPKQGTVHDLILHLQTRVNAGPDRTTTMSSTTGSPDLSQQNGTSTVNTYAAQSAQTIPDDALSQIRVFEVHQGKGTKVVPETYSVTNLSEWLLLYAERIPEEEVLAREKGDLADPGMSLDEDKRDRVIWAMHFDKEVAKAHGVPFCFLVKQVSLIISAFNRLGVT
ncbi:ubiquitin carboxyl-terminal hydrolase 21 [Viridothelium virens]|uniref:ubiquitinyl hydrolase 1 n=1 Tax=Viridothelium virens TaxID=1048519 RepID=A0A6A6HCR1_VIRVR|nr:ubiquitin carboxyl-terminal hydrolase 21 [Viridothelium virens]